MQEHFKVTICERMWIKWWGKFKWSIPWGESKGKRYLLNMNFDCKLNRLTHSRQCMHINVSLFIYLKYQSTCQVSGERCMNWHVWVWYIGECMVSLINIKNGIKQHPASIAIIIPTKYWYIVGFKIIIPVRYWYLVGMSKWGNLCIPKLLFLGQNHSNYIDTRIIWSCLKALAWCVDPIFFFKYCQIQVCYCNKIKSELLVIYIWVAPQQRR